MSMMHGRSNDGESLKNTNPLIIGAKDPNGKAYTLEVDADGYLKVVANLSIESVTATDVTIHDATTPANKLAVNTDGSVNAQVSGSKAQEYESITIDNTVGGVGLTSAKYGTCTKAFITVEIAQIRFTVDGTAPTITVGHLLNPSEILKLDSAEDIAAFKAIRISLTSATIHCTYSA